MGYPALQSSWNVMAHGDAREGKWRGKWRMEWVASTLHTTTEHGVSSISTADAHTSAASCRLNWRPRRFKWTGPFRRKTKSCCCACTNAFHTQSTKMLILEQPSVFWVDRNNNTLRFPYATTSRKGEDNTKMSEWMAIGRVHPPEYTEMTEGNPPESGLAKGE